jgi:ribosomal protein S18 acetylase RimI-like enzyme
VDKGRPAARERPAGRPVRRLTEISPSLSDYWIVHLIRPIRPEDKDALVRFHARLSADARYRRYHGVKGDLTPGDLRFLTETDDVTHVARVAIGGEGEIDAVARVVDGEIAVVVADGRRGSGLGRGVAAAAIEAFRRQNPAGPLTAYVQPDNGRALRLFQRLGARRLRAPAGDPLELVLP